MPILHGPEGLKPTPRQIAKKLFENFSVVDAHPLFEAWCEHNLIDEKTSKEAFKAEIEDKDFWDARSGPDSKPAALTGTEFLELNLPTPEWIIDRVIPKGGLVAFSGKPGSYKSFFALWLAMKASAGLPLFEECDENFFCKQNTELTPTMFIEEENTKIMTQDRYKGLRRFPSDFLYFRVEQRFKMQDESWRKALLKDVEAKGIGMIIVDPFSSVMGLENENDNAEVAVVMDLIRQEFINKGITVVFIHHPSKGDSDGKNLRGAGDILGKCDVHLHFEKDALDKRMITVSYEKMRLLPDDAVQNFKMRITGDMVCHDGHFRYLGEAKPKHEEEREALEKAIIEAFQSSGEASQGEIAEMVGSNRTGDKFQAAWGSLRASGKIIQLLDRKKWALK